MEAENYFGGCGLVNDMLHQRQESREGPLTWLTVKRPHGKSIVFTRANRQLSLEILERVKQV
jgi:hypothetical protein